MKAKKKPSGKLAQQFLKRKAEREKKTKGWLFERDGVSQGFIHYFLACREQTRLKYKELWNSYYEPLYREFGSCFHWLLGQI